MQFAQVLQQLAAGTKALQQAQISAKVKDDGIGGVSVSALYTLDGESWKRVDLASDGDDTYSTQITLPDGPKRVFVIVEAVDGAGNVATETVKGSLGLSEVLIPITVIP